MCDGGRDIIQAPSRVCMNQSDIKDEIMYLLL